MRAGRLLKQWLPPVVLALVALLAWQAANRADFDPSSAQAEVYDQELATPILSARRIPRTLRAPVSDALVAPGINQVLDLTPSNQVCLSVRNGDRVLGRERDVPGGLIPASNQKLLTTYAALGILGPDFTFNTRVVGSAPVTDGILDGDLYLVGDGDPFLFTDDWLSQYSDIDGRSHTRLEALADSVAATGLIRVTGSIIGDESRLDSFRYGPWNSRLIVQKQSGPMSALSVNEGFVVWPDTFRGSFRPRQETDNPPLNAAAVFNQLLRERNISVDGGTGVGVAPDVVTEVSAIQSPPLVDTVTHINSYSSNIGAELLLKRIGLAVLAEGSTEAGASAVTTFLTDQGIPMDGVQIFDGSGLAETDRLSCRALLAILLRTGPDTELGRSLSIAGRRGSLLNQFTETPADGLVLAKTGTLRGVKALSGYVRSAVPTEPESYVSFAYILNDDEVLEEEVIAALQVPFVTALASYPGGPSIASLSPLPPTPA